MLWASFTTTHIYRQRAMRSRLKSKRLLMANDLALEVHSVTTGVFYWSRILTHQTKEVEVYSRSIPINRLRVAALPTKECSLQQAAEKNTNTRSSETHLPIIFSNILFLPVLVKDSRNFQNSLRKISDGNKDCASILRSFRLEITEQALN